MTKKHNYKIQGRYQGTIDLHGYRKSEAISRLTSFLEEVARGKRGDVWVLVITGSGAHSQHGPILRTAVKALLEKRKMNFSINPGKGGFTVNANSGFVLYAPGLPTDSKVIVREPLPPVPRLPTKRPGYFPRPARPSDYSPSPAEVAANDAQFEDSKKEYEREARRENKERALLKKAMSMSVLEAEAEQQQEKEMLEKAMSLSMLETYNSEEDDELQRALEMSRQDTGNNQEDDTDLQKALALSREFVAAADDELHMAIEKSKLGYEHGIMGA